MKPSYLTTPLVWAIPYVFPTPLGSRLGVRVYGANPAQIIERLVSL
jgi:hypothetical protein